MDSEVRKEFKRLSKLISFKDKSDDFIVHEAQKNIKIRELVRTGNFINDNEEKFAKTLFNKYLNNYDYENMLDLSTLGVLVYNEVLVQRLQKTINDQKDSKGNFYLNDKLLKSLHETQKQVLDLKKELGLDKEKTQNELSAFQQQNKKLDLHIAFNKHEYSCVCSHCGKLLLLRRKTEDFEVLQHPAFVGRFLCNIRMLNDVESGNLSKEQMAHYMHTSCDYIQWLLDNKGKVIDVEGFNQDEINNFINSKDYLKELNKKSKKNGK